MIKKHKLAVVLICILIAVGAASLSAEAALRTAVFIWGSPKSAFTMEYEEIGEVGKFTTLYTIRENAPVERETQHTLYTWAVFSFGPFHYAYYYGEG